jgi:hypothetical protein
MRMPLIELLASGVYSPQSDYCSTKMLRAFGSDDDGRFKLNACSGHGIASRPDWQAACGIGC